MHLIVKTEINIFRVLREDVATPDDLARIAFEALDQCAARFYKDGNNSHAEAITKARTALTASLQTVWPAPQPRGS